MKAEVSAHELGQGITLKIEIRGLQVFRLRCWIGLQLLRLAAAVLPVDTDVKVI
jgi:hypothetical protein